MLIAYFNRKWSKSRGYLLERTHYQGVTLGKKGGGVTRGLPAELVSEKEGERQKKRGKKKKRVGDTHSFNTTVRQGGGGGKSKQDKP